jgi:hypothetical protein
MSWATHMMSLVIFETSNFAKTLFVDACSTPPKIVLLLSLKMQYLKHDHYFLMSYVVGQ